MGWQLSLKLQPHNRVRIEAGSAGDGLTSQASKLPWQRPMNSYQQAPGSEGQEKDGDGGMGRMGLIEEGCGGRLKARR